MGRARADGGTALNHDRQPDVLLVALAFALTGACLLLLHLTSIEEESKMPFVTGFLRLRRRPGRPGKPDQGLPPGEEPVDPGYGVPEGELPEVEPPEPPPGVWPGPTPSHPIADAPPDTPPGAIWPSPGKPDHPIAMPPQKLWVLVVIPGYGWQYICVDPSLKPTPH